MLKFYASQRAICDNRLMKTAELWERAKRRCAPHRHVPGVCRKCLLAEMEKMLLEKNPELCPGDAFELVQEWVGATERLEQ